MTDTVSGVCSCPACGENVESFSSEITCTHCDHSFALRNGVVDFRQARHDYHESPISRSELHRINEQFASRPWNDTLSEFLQLSGDVPRWLGEIVDEGRYAWKIFFALQPGMKLLDFGCGLGASTKNLAPHFSHTYAVDLTYENAVFSRHRLDAFNSTDDITVVVSGDSPRLPFNDLSIDAAFASNILEVVGEGDMSEYVEGGTLRRLWNGVLSSHGRRNPRSHQLALLREFSRILKDDGAVYIDCRNRMDYKQFTGDVVVKPNETAMPFLPRMVANLFSLIRMRRPNRRYTHSIFGYRRLLRQAGFPYVEFVGLYQDGDQVEGIRPGSGHFPFWAPPPPSSWKQRIKQSPYVAPSFGIIARKEPSKFPSFENALVDKVVHQLGVKREDYQVKHYLVSPKGKLIVRVICGQQELYVRLPLNEQATKAELHNHGKLGWLKMHRPAMPDCFPVQVLKGNVMGQQLFVESAVHGTPIIDLLKEQRSVSGSLQMGLDFLIRLNEPSAIVHPKLDGDAYERLVSKPLRSLAALITLDEMTQLEEFFLERVESKRLPRGLLHGDFSARNILVDREGVSGLLDWEESDTDGVPALDAICLTLSCCRVIEADAKVGESLVGLARRSKYLRDYLRTLDIYYDRSGVDTSCHEGLVFLYWVQIISHHVRLGRTYQQTEIGKFVSRMVKLILEDNNVYRH